MDFNAGRIASIRMFLDSGPIEAIYALEADR
jgi:hypothetical protein